MDFKALLQKNQALLAENQALKEENLNPGKEGSVKVVITMPHDQEK